MEDVDATDCSERTLSRLDVRLNVVAPGVVAGTAIGISEGLASESPEEFVRVTFFEKENILLRTCGDVGRSSPEADRSPNDAEFGGRCVKEIIEDVRRDFSFVPWEMKIHDDG